MDRLVAHQKLRSMLKKNHYSITDVRKTVFDILLNKEPQTMAEIIDQTGSAVDRASVYRTIELFEKLGITERVSIGWKYKLELTDIFRSHHHHLHCEICGRTIPIENSRKLEGMINSLTEEADFHPISHQLEITGHCPTCQ